MEIECLESVKLLGYNCYHKLTWNENITYNSSKVSKRLYHPKQLSRAGLVNVDLLAFYGYVFRPVLEYACPVWHTSLAVADSAKIESVQRRAMRIIEPELSSDAACTKHHLEITSCRRENLSTKIIFENIIFLIPLKSTSDPCFFKGIE